MLKSLDIVIAFSVIMLMVSMSVTLITEWFLRLLEVRGKKLLEGVAALLHQIDPQLLTKDHAEEIARKVLTYPLATRAGSKLAEVVQREELVKIVLGIGASAIARMPQPAVAAAVAGGAPATPPPPTPSPAGGLPTAAETALVQVLRNAGIANPAAALDSIRMSSMRLEGERPDLATNVRETMAIISQAESQFVAKVNGWFDQTMDRVSYAFSSYSRYWTVGISLILAFGLQLDAIKLINRLSVDDTIRKELVAQAETAATSTQPSANTTLDAQTQDNIKDLQQLATDQLITWPPFRNGHVAGSIPGVLIAGLLISLGAPFWFNLLGNVLKLRPSLAAKDDAQRASRQFAQPPPPNAPPPDVT